MSECADCGRPASDVLVLGFFCEHERCPLMRPPAPDETYDEAFQRSLAFQDASDDGGDAA